jgi:acyl-coenzyme A thioesterase PaaI-like protein
VAGCAGLTVSAAVLRAPARPAALPIEARLPVMSQTSATTRTSLQEHFAPHSRCFGCGPANEQGLRIRSREEGGELVADWAPQRHHAAFEGVLNGGIIGTLLDCHANWTAAIHLMRAGGGDAPPSCVTAEYAIRLLRPTPMDRPIQLRARVVESSGNRATVEAELSAGGRVTATCRGTFVAVGPDHPAWGRW